jgi:hypothetical protein
MRAILGNQHACSMLFDFEFCSLCMHYSRVHMPILAEYLLYVTVLHIILISVMIPGRGRRKKNLDAMKYTVLI